MATCRTGTSSPAGAACSSTRGSPSDISSWRSGRPVIVGVLGASGAGRARFVGARFAGARFAGARFVGAGLVGAGFVGADKVAGPSLVRRTGNGRRDRGVTVFVRADNGEWGNLAARPTVPGGDGE
ncbi:pentapeptide repeat-containing protein [Kitasatospora sp. NRRL B-11411]|uniref:pentapeptide repeat-containing protein n=1 Tax=Kitasatospora sp. NRRL B-11411 TaxID=1463822 RepID=UPI0012FEEC2A